MPAEVLDAPAVVRPRKTKPRIEDQNPHIASTAIRAYAQTKNSEKAGKLAGIAANTVLAIVRRTPEEFARVNNELAAKAQIIAGKCMDKLMEPEKLDECSPAQLAVITGIHVDKTMVLQGAMPVSGLDMDDIRKLVRVYNAIAGEVQNRQTPRTIDVTEPQEGLTNAGPILGDQTQPAQPGPTDAAGQADCRRDVQQTAPIEPDVPGPSGRASA